MKQVVPSLARGDASLRFVCHPGLGVEVACDSAAVAPDIEASIAGGWYETEEAALGREVIGRHDRVLELGGGVGAVAAFLWTACRPARYAVFEPNPEIKALLSATLARNGATGVEVRDQILTNDVQHRRGGQVRFFLADEFWSSSTVPGAQAARACTVATLPFAGFLRDFRPTVIIADIEGGELDLIGGLAEQSLLQRITGGGPLKGVEAIVLELHPEVIGEEGVRKVVATLHRLGFARDAATKAGTVVRFRRSRRHRWRRLGRGALRAMKRRLVPARALLLKGRAGAALDRPREPDPARRRSRSGMRIGTAAAEPRA